MFPHRENTSRHARGPTGLRTAGKQKKTITSVYDYKNDKIK